MDQDLKDRVGGIGGRAAESTMEYLEKSGLSEEAQVAVAWAMDALAFIARGTAQRLPAAEEHAGMNVWYTFVIRTVQAVQDGINDVVDRDKA